MAHTQRWIDESGERAIKALVANINFYHCRPRSRKVWRIPFGFRRNTI